jgi:hypothetical protein
MSEYKSGFMTTAMCASVNKEHVINNLAYLLKSRTVEPEKQPLLENGSEKTFVSRQRPRNRQFNDIR